MRVRLTAVLRPVSRLAGRVALALLLGGCAARPAAPAPSTQTVSLTVDFTVDFAAERGPALSKDKFGVYQTPFWFKKHPPATFDMTPLLAEAGVRDLRYELAWGKPDAYAFDSVRGTAAKPEIDFAPLDPFYEQLKTAHVRLLLAMTYDPLPLKRGDGWQRWKDAPADLQAWREIHRRYAAHMATLGMTPFYEIWNEPDLPGDGGKTFFNGTPEAYGQVYRAAVAGLRDGAADARVGGPAIAYDTAYLKDSGILDAPLDFISCHAYADAPERVAAIKAAAGDRATPIFLTEYASYKTFGVAAPQSRFMATAAFFHDVRAMLDDPRIAKVHWAQWIDDDLGMLTEDLHRKALFNAYAIYQTMLPAGRRTVTPDAQDGIESLAAADAADAAIVLWNTSASPRRVRVAMKWLPAEHGTLALSRIDATHGSYADQPSSERLRVDERWPFADAASAWSGEVPAGAVVLIRIER